MAKRDASKPGGVRVLIEDYPYANDGLLIWSAIEAWVKGYVEIFYPDNRSVSADNEIQSWWNEIKNKGHPDKRDGWPKLNSRESLTHILTTMIWTASGQHAAINFGQYPLAGYLPNRPTIMKEYMPNECNDLFLRKPERAFLSSMPSRIQVTQMMTTQYVLSAHAPDEEYLGQRSLDNWINNGRVKTLFDKFSHRVKEIEDIIHKRNEDTRLKNRNGAGIPPYQLLLPTSNQGVTGRGIPNSISI